MASPNPMRVILVSGTERPVETLYTAWVVSRCDDIPDTYTDYPNLMNWDEDTFEQFKEDHHDEFPYERTAKSLMTMNLPILEMISFTFCVQDIPLSLREQLVRHGKFTSFWMQTSRVRSLSKFVDEGHYRLPPVFNKPERAKEKAVFLGALETCQNAYRELTEAGIQREDARDIIPAYSHNMFFSCNLRALRTILSSRVCFTGDTKVSLLDGTERRLDEIRRGEEVWVYSLDAEGQITPGRAVGLGSTKTVSELLEVTLDNGETIRCTPDHPFMLRDGTYLEAQYLTEGQSLMPLYRTTDAVDGFKMVGYEKVFSPKEGKYVLTHHLTIGELPERLKESSKYGNVRHHKDFNCRNNSPENLEWMRYDEHRTLHGEPFKRLWADPQKRAEGVERNRQNGLKSTGANLVQYNASEEGRSFKKKFFRSLRNDPRIVARQLDGSKLSMTKFNSDPENKKRRNRLSLEACRKSQTFLDSQVRNGKRLSKRFWSEEEFSEGRKKLAESASSRIIERNKIPAECDICGKVVGNVGALHQHKRTHEVVVNHKVLSVRRIFESCEVYDLEVEKYHNFALTSGVFVHNCQMAQPNLWGPFIEQIATILREIDPILEYAMPHPPCVGNDGCYKSCPVATDNHRRLNLKTDPNPPCTLWYNKEYLTNPELKGQLGEEDWDEQMYKDYYDLFGRIWGRNPETYEKS